MATETAKTEKLDKAPARQAARMHKHVGWLVVSPIRYMTPEGSPRSAGVGEVISDLTEDDRVRFEREQVVTPKYETTEVK